MSSTEFTTETVLTTDQKIENIQRARIKKSIEIHSRACALDHRSLDLIKALDTKDLASKENKVRIIFLNK